MIRTFIARPVFTGMLTLSVIVFGVVAYPKIGVDQFPKVDFPVVTVMTVLPGADPEAIERTVTKPLEEAVNTLQGLVTLRSVNVENVSQVIVESPDDFQARAESMASLPSDPTEAGRLLFGRYGCTSCHVLAHAGASGLVGPSLEGIGARAGSTVAGLDAEAYLRQSIVEPNAHIVPTYLENLMP